LKLDIVRLVLSPSATVDVNLFGATIVSWLCQGEELLFVRWVGQPDLSKTRKFTLRLFGCCCCCLAPATGRCSTTSSRSAAVFPWCFPTLARGSWAPTTVLPASCHGTWSLGRAMPSLPRRSLRCRTMPQAAPCGCVTEREQDSKLYPVALGFSPPSKLHCFFHTLDPQNHQFRLELTVTLTADSLTTAFTVHNTGSTDFDFTVRPEIFRFFMYFIMLNFCWSRATLRLIGFQALLHTYLRTADIGQVTVSGLHQLPYVDKVSLGYI
jgi:hypothetical protein